MSITALTVTVLAGGKLGPVVRKHNSAAFAMRYAEGRQAEAKLNGSGKEYGVIVLPSDTNFNSLGQTTETSAQPSARRGGAKRFPFAVVKLASYTSSRPDDAERTQPTGIAGRNSTYDKARVAANTAASRTGRNHGVLIRTATRGGAFPKFKNA